MPAALSFSQQSKCGHGTPHVRALSQIRTRKRIYRSCAVSVTGNDRRADSRIATARTASDLLFSPWESRLYAGRALPSIRCGICFTHSPACSAAQKRYGVSAQRTPYRFFVRHPSQPQMNGMIFARGSPVLPHRMFCLQQNRAILSQRWALYIPVCIAIIKAQKRDIVRACGVVKYYIYIISGNIAFSSNNKDILKEG